MPRMPKQTCGTTVIYYNSKNSIKDLENRIKKLEEALSKKDEGPSEKPDVPTVPDKPKPDVETVDIYFYDGAFSPEDNDYIVSQGWVKESVTSTSLKEGIVHIYDPTEEFYPAIAYPESLGELSHIYQGGSTAFDLLEVFKKEIVSKGAKKYWRYYFPDSVVAAKTVLTFLWAN